MPYIGTGRISLFFEEAGNDGIPLLLLHELGGSSESWREVIPLRATDRRVLAVDMRCAGRSEKPPGAFALADVADDLDELLRALNLEGPVGVIGAALGSLAGRLLVVGHPAKVPRVVRCGVATQASSFTASHAPPRAAYRVIYLGNDPAAYAELSLVLGRLEMAASDWGAIRARVLVASGAHDFLWPPAIGRQVAALIPGARFEVMEDAGHF